MPKKKAEEEKEETSGYDPAKDELLAAVGTVEVDKRVIAVEVRRYDEGEARIRVKRVITKKSGDVVRRDAANFTSEEARAVAPLLLKGADALDAVPPSTKKKAKK